MRLGGLGFLSLQGVGEADGIRQSVFESVWGKVSRQEHFEVYKGMLSHDSGIRDSHLELLHFDFMRSDDRGYEKSK